MVPQKPGRHLKIDPAPRDRAPFGSVKYPQIKEGGLNKYAKTEKDKRTAEAVDNLDIVLKSNFAHESKKTTEVMGLKIEAEKLVWILINDDAEHGIAKMISKMFESLEQTENTMRPLCS